MSRFIKLQRGFDINLAGRAESKIADCPQPETFSLKPTDFIGLQRPKVLVEVRDNVKAGTPLMFDKMQEDVLFTSPVSGEVVEINRGEKRKLLDIRILADKEVEFEEFQKHSVSEVENLTREAATRLIKKSGNWPNIIMRPYGVIANPEDTPKSIFISGFDSSPLAPDYDFIYKGNDQSFQAGIDVLKKFTTGQIHLNINSKAEVPHMFAHAKGVELNKFSGPHPAGNVGVQIHHLDPVNKREMVWTLSPQGVIQIGRLFIEGRYDTSTLVALTGSEIKEPQYYSTYSGAGVNKMLENNLKQENVRIISGNVLSGEAIQRRDHLGFYHQHLTVIPEGNYHEMFGWLLPTFTKLSFHGALGLLSGLNSAKKEYVLDTNTRGEKRSFVQTGVFEKVVPMDILPTYLIKAILAEDYDDMEALGIYEVIEEDLALCEFIDVSKHEIQQIVRDGINLLMTSN